METVGMIGVGTMGTILLQHLRAAGLAVAAYDCDSAALERARSLGAEVARSSRAVAETATLIDVVVRTDSDIFACMTGPDGALAGARAGTLVLLHSTIHPRTTRAVAEQAREKGVHVIDACMVGSPRIARSGNITFLVGGPPDLVERARPHLLRMGKDVIHMGALSMGNVGKLVKNLVTGAETLVVYEAAELAHAAGVDYRAALEMLQKTHTGTMLERWREVFDPARPAPMPGAGQNVFEKDIPLAAALARDLNLDLAITAELAATALRVVEAHRKERFGQGARSEG
ncbi:MAG TPA: NAD(P)-dependent oxidoreductase [Candidatus Acidoferrales bacterium]|nr:NAD(P)-dependent oxidoreductase [Candidatus Acidoferrales bacterium]